MARGKPTPLESLRPWFKAKLAWAEGELEALGHPRKVWKALGIFAEGGTLFQLPVDLEPFSKSPLFFWQECDNATLEKIREVNPEHAREIEEGQAFREWVLAAPAGDGGDERWRAYWTAGIAVAANNGAVSLSENPIQGFVYARVIEAFEAKRNLASRGPSVRKQFAREWSAELGKRPKSRRNDPRARAKARALQLHAQGRSGGEIRLDREFRKAYVSRDRQPLQVDAPESDSRTLKASIERNIRNWTNKAEN